jgi:RNA recognition motif-containing protein
MSTEIAVIAGSSVAGVMSAVFLGKLFRIRSNNKKYARSSSSSISSIRAELLSLLFEKNLTAEAITRVYEAARDGRIDRFERDKLLLKYKQQLDSLNQKVAYLQPVSDFSDLKELRNNLVYFLEDRISALDKKLLELSKSNPPSQDDIDTKVKKILAETSNMQQQSVTPIEQKMFKAEEQSIEQLHKEIVQALQHLERVEIDKD